jgi:hypothetical protein
MGNTAQIEWGDACERVVRDISGQNNQQRVASSNFSRKWR